MIYIHGKGGSSEEANRYKSLFENYDVVGFSYKSKTTWEARTEFSKYFDDFKKKYDEVTIIANSIIALCLHFEKISTLGCL